MAFVIPTFNLTCNVFTGGVFSNPARATFPCNLAYSRRANVGSVIVGAAVLEGGFMFVLLPSGTDVRDKFQAGGQDGIEVPAGSGRRYLVEDVDDVGKGFPNEFRCACVRKTSVWPTPVP